MTRTDLDGLGYRGKTVVLTGGASGMGEAAARLLGEMGAIVHIADIQQPSIACASYVPVDLSDPASIAKAAAELRAVGPIDFLLPVAGLPPHAGGPLHCLLVNYAGTRQFTEELLPAVRDGGSVGLIASVAARNWQQHLEENLKIVGIRDFGGVRGFYEANPEALRDGYSPSKELLFVWIQQIAPRLADRWHFGRTATAARTRSGAACSRSRTWSCLLRRDRTTSSCIRCNGSCCAGRDLAGRDLGQHPLPRATYSSTRRRR